MPLPFVPILIALRDDIAAEIQSDANVRHFRARFAREGDYPDIAIRFVSNDPSSDGRQESAYGLPEAVWDLSIDIIIEAALQPEEDDPASHDGDPTGFAEVSTLMERVLNRLIPGGDAPENTLGGLVWNIRYDGSAPDDDDITPDYARIHERLTIQYRVRADRPTELLTGE